MTKVFESIQLEETSFTSKRTGTVAVTELSTLLLLKICILGPLPKSNNKPTVTNLKKYKYVHTSVGRRFKNCTTKHSINKYQLIGGT